MKWKTKPWIIVAVAAMLGVLCLTVVLLSGVLQYIEMGEAPEGLEDLVFCAGIPLLVGLFVWRWLREERRRAQAWRNNPPDWEPLEKVED